MTANRAQLTLEFLNPDVQVVAAGDHSYYLLGGEGIPEGEIAGLAAGGEPSAFCERNQGALIVKVESEGDRARRLRVWRGLFSTAEFYFSTAPQREVVGSDHFRNVIVRLERADRYPSRKAVVQHYLYRRPYGHVTYSAKVSKVGQAEAVVVDLQARTVSVSMFDRLDAAVVKRSREDYLDMMDAELQIAMQGVDYDDSAALLFSGGVDSTLLMSYLGDRAQPVTFVPDTPEFGAETEYARSAARMVDVDPLEVATPESEFLDMLEFNTETLGTPSLDDSSPYFTRIATSQPHGTFIFGQGADSAFGMSLKLARFSSWFRWPGVRHAINAGASRVPGHLGYRLGQVGAIADRLRHPLLDRRGYGASARVSGHTALLERVLGLGAIEEANQSSLDYALERVALAADPSKRFLSHTELAHWHIVMVNPLASAHAASQAAGKRSLGPFCAPNVLSALATIPVEDRYIRGLSAKWILKDLLQRKVPDYPVNKRKKATALPWQRFYENGPLTNIWDRYDVPDLFRGDERDELVARPIATTWVAISHAIWLDRVVRNDGLTPHQPVLAAAVPI